MSTYSGQKAHHFLKEAICFKLQRSFPCLKKGNFIHRLQFSFQTKYDFVQETVPLQNMFSIPLNMQCFLSEEVQSSFQTKVKSVPAITQYFFQSTRFQHFGYVCVFDATE